MMHESTHRYLAISICSKVCTLDLNDLKNTLYLLSILAGLPQERTLRKYMIIGQFGTVDNSALDNLAPQTIFHPEQFCTADNLEPWTIQHRTSWHHGQFSTTDNSFAF